MIGNRGSNTESCSTLSSLAGRHLAGNSVQGRIGTLLWLVSPWVGPSCVDAAVEACLLVYFKLDPVATDALAYLL